jgi:NAD(P)-dependent dehydrogenase (short-subunit alcohol dehydrogenase family)
MKSFDLVGKVAVITGASRGIGKAIAEQLASQGARVAISSRSIEACEAVAADLNARYGDGTAIAVAANISRKGDLEQLVRATQERLGAIDILICNAATNPYYGPMLEIADDQFEKILSNNILSNHWLVQLVAPEMIERKNGAIVIISSIGGLTGSSVVGAYNVSKAADIQLARNLALELGVHNIRVNCVAPGLIRTDFARALWENPDTQRRVAESTALRRIGEADEIAGAVGCLVSAAGTFITGQALVIDGGAMVTGLTP